MLISEKNFPHKSKVRDNPWHGGARELLAEKSVFAPRKQAVSPYINRFRQPDTLIPSLSNPQSWNRFNYTLNSPTRYTDPNGHCTKASYPGEVVTDDVCEQQPPPASSGDPEISDNDADKDRDEVSAQLKFCVEHPYAPQCDFRVTDLLIGPSSNPLPLACRGVPSQQGLSLAETLEGLREVCEHIDPFLPGELTGTNLSYMQAVSQAAGALQAWAPGNPYSRPLTVIAPIAPLACAGYDCAYDLITGTGEYSTIADAVSDNTVVTPNGVGYTVLVILILLPGIPPLP